LLCLHHIGWLVVPVQRTRTQSFGNEAAKTPRRLSDGGRRYGTLSRSSTLPLWHPCHGDRVMDRNNRIGRRERFEILKIAQRFGERVVAVDKGPLRPLRPNTILGALEESITRRNREGRIWPAFLDQFWCWNAPFCGDHHVRARQRTRARASSSPS